MRVSEIRVNQIRVNQGLGVLEFFVDLFFRLEENSKVKTLIKGRF